MEKRKFVFLLTLVFILILTGAFGVWYFSQDWSESDIPEYGSIKNDKDYVKKDITHTLKTYKNDELGFEFSYPEDVRVKEEGHGPYLLFYMSIGGGMLNPYYFAVEDTDETNIELLDKHFFRRQIESIGPRIKEEHYKKLPNVGLARITTFKESLRSGSTEETYVQFIHNGKLFSFLTRKTPNYDITGTILSTFKFLK